MEQLVTYCQDYKRVPLICSMPAGPRGLIVAVSLPLARTVCLINGYLWPFRLLQQLRRKYILLVGLGTEISFSGRRYKMELKGRLCTRAVGASEKRPFGFSLLVYSVQAYF